MILAVKLIFSGMPGEMVDALQVTSFVYMSLGQLSSYMINYDTNVSGQFVKNELQSTILFAKLELI